MLRAGFTVHMKNGVAYDANDLTVTRGQGEKGAISYLSFTCSGVLEIFPAEAVQEVEWHRTGIHWCGECDAPIANFVGEGLHANAPAPPCSV